MKSLKTIVSRFLARLYQRDAVSHSAEASDHKILSNPFIAGTYLPADPTGRYHLVLRPATDRSRHSRFELPVPPRELWEGYGQDEQAYLASGRRHVGSMLEILRNAGCAPEALTNVLDFGCAAGRMLRFFPYDDERNSELWGVDINAKYIGWCQNNLSPPYLFATITTLPHLPFEDDFFDLVYCGSVFTHIAPDLADAWLLELRRVLRKGGLAYITIQDKTSIRSILSRDTGSGMAASALSWEKSDGEPGTSSGGIYWISEFNKTVDLCSLNLGCFSFVADGALNVFYDAEYISDRWSRFIEFVSLTPYAYGSQSALLFRKNDASATMTKDDGGSPHRGLKRKAAKPLFGLRLVVTLPPVCFFGGLDRQRANDHTNALRRLGAAVYEYNTEPVYLNDQSALQRQVEEIRAFCPDAVVGTQHAGYALQGGMTREQDHTCPDPSLAPPHNLFLDILDLPTILFWDHFLTQAPRYLVPSWPSFPQDSEAGVTQILKRLMMHPNVMHFFPDSGHLAEARRFGLMANYDPYFVTAVSQSFVEHGASKLASSAQVEKIAFFGNIYLAGAQQIPYGQREDLVSVRNNALQRCASDWDLPPYTAYLKAVSDLTDECRSELHLDEDQSFYWRFLFDELSIVANGDPRFRILAACSHPIAFYGGFGDPDSKATLAERKWLLRASLPHDRSLAEAYRSTQVSLDVVNAPFIHGFSPKLIECFASGGFMLTTRKKDMSRVFGELANSIGYSNADELNAKVDYYLTHESERRGVTREMQDIIRRDHTAVALFSRTLPDAIERMRAQRR